MALDGNEWRRFQKRIILPDRYAVVFFLGEISSDIRSKIAQYAAEIKCEVLEPSSLKDRYYTIDPREFVYLIGNADIVFTDSFHAIAFSINLNVPFYAFERHQDFEEYEHMMSRIHSLLQLTGLSSRIYDSNEKLNKDCNFEISNSILENERVRLRQYLKRSLAQKDLKPFCLPDGACIGCGVCAERCMTDSIVMQTDGEGFLRPVFKTDACVNCGVCLQACPVLNNHYLKKDEEKRILYAAFQKDKEQLINSSSGAVFPLLADYVIGRGGVVYGAAFTDSFEVEHIRVDDKETVKRLRGSKYVQSTAYKIFKMVDEDIRKQKEVLFIGTPCQVGALKSFLGEERTDLTNLYTVDFVCHGVPSPGIWKSFLKGVKNTYLNGEDIHEISFRQKERITGPIHILVIKSNGSIYRSDSLHDPFYRAFLNNVSLRPSCYDCHFKGIKRNCDLTIGDFWGIEEIRPDASGEWGTSLVIIQTKKGTDLFQNVVHNLNATEINLSEIVGKHNLSLTESCQEHPCRRQFFNATALDFQNRADLYCIPVRRSLQKRIINKINKILSVKS